MVLPLLKTIRPQQWVKNLFAAAPVLFAQRLTDGIEARRAAWAVGIFCMISSAVYLWNDLVDIEADRAHPKKRSRPIASGALPVPSARIAAATFAALGLAVAFWLDRWFAACAGGYLGLNVLYSLWLKRIPYLDVLVIAAGFLLRVLGGALAVAVHPSPWLLLCTGLLASFLGFGKRAHELRTAGDGKRAQRAVLSHYHPGLLRAALWATGSATLVSYTLYTLAEHTRTFFRTDKMVWTAPFIAIGVGRYLMLVGRSGKSESPTEEMLRDPIFIANLGAWVAVVLWVIYVAAGSPGA